jgi:hypothetical protein
MAHAPALTLSATGGGPQRAAIAAARASAVVTHPKEDNMTRFGAIVLGAAMALASGMASAFHCPADMKKIDDAMAKGPQLSADQMAQVKKYRAEGETLHKAGKHQESVDTLARAMKILNIK